MHFEAGKNLKKQLVCAGYKILSVFVPVWAVSSFFSHMSLVLVLQMLGFVVWEEQKRVKVAWVVSNFKHDCVVWSEFLIIGYKSKRLKWFLPRHARKNRDTAQTGTKILKIL